MWANKMSLVCIDTFFLWLCSIFIRKKVCSSQKVVITKSMFESNSSSKWMVVQLSIYIYLFRPTELVQSRMFAKKKMKFDGLMPVTNKSIGHGPNKNNDNTHSCCGRQISYFFLLYSPYSSVMKWQKEKNMFELRWTWG